MKINCLFFATILLLFFTRCQSISNQINGAFDTIDKSLQESNKVLFKSTDELYSTINSVRQKNELIALKADSIYFVIKQANNYLDSVREKFKLQDNLNPNLTVATRLFVLTDSGENLKKVLMNVHTSVKSYSVENSERNNLDSTMQSFYEIQNNAEWTKIYFEKNSTNEAMVMLGMFQNNCGNVGVITLGDIKKRLSK